MTTTTAAKPTTASLVSEFVQACKTAGFRFTSRTYGADYVIEVSTSFTPGNASAYLTAERDSYNLLSLVPVVSYGSTWGSDSGSVGGHTALTSGQFRMCKSGVGRRFGAALAKVAR